MASLRLRLAGWGLAVIFGLAAPPAFAAATDWIGDANVAVRLITATDTVGGGPTIQAGLAFRYGAGWHGSWRNPGDAGLAPKVDWSGSQGIGAATLAWPAPRRLVVGDLQTLVYDTEIVLPVTLERRGDGPARLQAVVRHAVCGEICIPYRAELNLTLPAGPALDSAEASGIAAALARVPGTPARAGIVVTGTAFSADANGPILTVDLHSDGPAFVAPDLFVEGLPHGAPPAPSLVLADAGRTAHLSVALPREAGNPPPLRLTLVDGARAAEFPAGPLSAPAAGGSGLLAILATALLGGLILNLMPCVLPVLSLKVFSLARHAGAGAATIRTGMLATAGGIVASFLALAVALVALKVSGASIGWGIQFQQPWFLAGMAVLTVAFAASLFEWVSIGLPSRLAALGSTRGRGPLSEAFLTGAFATLLATPCSAPFVGTAVGFALAQGPAEILATFVALGLGMALPYLAGAAWPALLGLVPRPGPWMRTLRLGLGLILLGTAAWLVFVLWQVAGAASAALVAVLLAVLLAHLARRRRARGLAGTAIAGLVALAAVAGAMFSGTLLPGTDPAPAPGSGAWRRFDPAALPGYVAEGRTVIVDVTAAWCLTCKINEATTFSRSEVRDRLDRPDVVRMRADWTQPDPAILAYLRSFGRYGIPLVVVYGPGRPSGEALPELLGAGLVLAALDRAGAASAHRVAGAGKSP